MTSNSPRNLLVEIRTEELPPAQLWRLADAFPDSLLDALRKAGFADGESHRAKNEIGGGDKLLATPRRLVALLQNVKSASAAKTVIRRGPQLAACKDSEGAPTKALIGFMRSAGATCENDLIQTEEGGRTYIAWRSETPGRKLAEELAAIVERVLLDIPAPRKMRWGDNDFKFVRPVRGVLMMHGDEIIRGEVCGIPASDSTKGHPVPSAEILAFTASEYETVMHEHGKVIVDMDKRLEKIRAAMVNEEIGEDMAFLLDDADEVKDNTGWTANEHNEVHPESPLLREVAAMCEWPAVYRRKVDDEFMDLPIYCVSECMKKHQKFFPFQDEHGKLLPDYFLVADNEPESSDEMLRGYDAVLRARLRDVRFYYDEDRKVSLDEYMEKLKTIVFHQKLGSQHDRIGRVCRIAAALAELNGERHSAEEIADAARKILAPLSSLMVGEYPQLQEYMARKYFAVDKNSAFVLVSPCYDLEKLAGMFGADEIPTGSKDPHGLRRNALEIALRFRNWRDIKQSIAAAAESFDGKIADVRGEVYEFILDRIRFMFSRNAPFKILAFAPAPNVVESVLSLKPTDLRKLDRVMDAVRDFAKTDDARILIAANKRINNILRKSEGAESAAAADESLFSEDAERVLYETVRELRARTDAQIARNDYAGALKTLAEAAAPADAFFAEVLVNAEDRKIRANRFALLRELRALLNRVADISKLA
ncbi:MAG: glycine--tRNA ligase subunit beta [Gammaproteobacteria bacterium]